MSESSSEAGLANGRIPEFVDWLVAAAIGLTGLVSLLFGSTIGSAFDRETIEESVESEDFEEVLTSSELSQAEAVEVVDALVAWAGWGLLVTGIGLVLFAIGFVIVRRRAYKRARAGEEIRSFGAFATLGAVASIFLSFIPFSTVLGAGIAGYLEAHDGGRTVSVGALSGVLPIVPVLVILCFLGVGIYDGLNGVGEGEMGFTLIGLLLVGGLIYVIVGAILGAIGGYVGGWVAGRSESAR